MGEIIKRKCTKCKGEIEIDRDNITDVIYYDKKYYHGSCFESHAAQRAASKRGKFADWQEALDRIWELETETKKMLEHFWARDDLNNWLLKNYNITVIPSRFWQIIADLEIGKYKGKQCKPIDVELVYGCWKWGQQKLNGIAKNNKMNHRGPTSDDGRIMYDLSIVVSKIPNYLSHKSKMKMLEVEEKRKTEIVHVNYDNIQKTKTENNNGLDDISDLLDDIF